MKDYLSGTISILASFQLLFVALFLFMHKKGNRNSCSYAMGIYCDGRIPGGLLEIL